MLLRRCSRNVVPTRFVTGAKLASTSLSLPHILSSCAESGLETTATMAAATTLFAIGQWSAAIDGLIDVLLEAEDSDISFAGSGSV
jgi:hypothetical protein